MASNNATFSVIGSDVTITGDIQASADLHVDGTIDGDLTCASLVQGEGSTIHGAITADTATLSGQVDGAITVGQLTVSKSARINGDVTYDDVTVEQGAQVNGRFASKSAAAASAKPASAKTQNQDNADQAKLSLAG